MTYVLLTVFGLVLAFFALNEYYLWVVMVNLQEVQIVKGKSSKKKYDAIAFGSAYCRYSIDFGEYNGFNFGVGSQFFYYTDKMLREIAPQCLKKGGTVFLVIADLVFAEVGKGLYGPERYQLILSKKSLGDEFNFRTYMKVRFPLLMNPFLIKRIIGYMAHLFIHNKKKKEEVFTEEQVFQAAVERCNGWCKEFGLTDTNTNSIPYEMEEKFRITRTLLTQMIQFCIDNNYKPVLVVTPVSRILNSMLSDEFLDKVLYNNIEKSNIQNVTFLNYLRDERFSSSDCYKMSSDLMNNKARLRFTNILLKDALLN